MARWWQPLFTTALGPLLDQRDPLDPPVCSRRESCRFAHPIISGSDNVELNLLRLTATVSNIEPFYAMSRRCQAIRSNLGIPGDPQWIINNT